MPRIYAIITSPYHTVKPIRDHLYRKTDLYIKTTKDYISPLYKDYLSPETILFTGLYLQVHCTIDQLIVTVYIRVLGVKKRIYAYQLYYVI